ncbi:MAG: HD domain-containing phosphohydrolase, partial [Planctomycetaceae bacterium]
MSDTSIQFPALQEFPPQLVKDVRETLCNAFSCSFEIWENNDRWSPVAAISLTDETDSTDLPGHLIRHDDVRLEDADVADAIARAAAELQPVVEPLDDHRYLVAIPVDGESGLPLMAVGLVEGTDWSMIGRLADTASRLLTERRQNRSSTAEIDYYIRQVNDDFEELAWLRNLAHHLEYTEVDQSLASVTDKVLPSLQQLINTESLVFFPVDSRDQRHHAPPECGDPLIYGKQDVNVDDCRKIIERYHQQSIARPVVYNKSFDNPYVSHAYDLASFALVRVAKSKYSVGFLLALNKIPSRHYQYDHPEAEEVSAGERPSNRKYCGSEYAFGTIEVGLMQEAGILLAIHDRNRFLFKEQEGLVVGIIRAMVNAIDAKDPYTCGHSDRVALMAKRLTRQMEFDSLFCERIYMTGLLHDVGKIGIPDTVLQKPGRLTDEEFDIIKQHPVIGYHILKHLKPLSYVLPGVLHHHESFDGNGYPGKLVGENIPLEGRILAVVDAYDAMTSNRA